MIGLVVPTKTDAYARRLLRSLMTCEPGWPTPDEPDGEFRYSRVVLVENGLSPECIAEFHRYETRYISVENCTTDPWPGVPATSSWTRDFVFARAINWGVRQLDPHADILIMNDDAVFCSPHPITKLEALLADSSMRDSSRCACGHAAEEHDQKAVDTDAACYAMPQVKGDYEDCSCAGFSPRPQFGVIGLRVAGGVGNPDQAASLMPNQILETDKAICFVAALIPRKVWDAIGPMDERYVGYGCLNAESRVLLEDGSTMPIGRIVNRKLDLRVLSMNTKTRAVEAKRVTNWWKQQGPEGQKWIKVALRHARPQTRPGWSISGAVFTPDHLIHAEHGWTDAQSLKPGDRVFIHEPRLSERQREFILGSLLGDGTLPRRNRSRAGFSVTHCESQWEYLALKRRMLGRWFSSEVECHPVGFAGSGRAQRARKVNSAYSVELSELRASCYPEGKQALTQSWLNHVGVFGLAVFYLDDGVYHQKSPGRGSVRISCHNYGASGAALIQGKLMEYGLDTAIDVDTRTEKYSPGLEPVSVRLRQDATRRFLRMIAPFVPPSLRYKLGHYADMPPFDPDLWEPEETDEAYTDEVLSVEPYDPKTNPSLYRTRYCLTVEDNDNFFTASGLAHNCDDADLCRSAVAAGYKLGVTGAATVRHGGAGISGPGMHGTFARECAKVGPDEHTRLYLLNQRLYAEKWGESGRGNVTGGQA